MPPIHLIFISLLALINIIAIIVMYIDKYRSTHNGSNDRIPEGVLFFLATTFGSAGIYLSMFMFRHKIRKWYFQLGIPLLLLQNVTLLYIVYNFINI